MNVINECNECNFRMFDGSSIGPFFIISNAQSAYHRVRSLLASNNLLYK